MRLNSFQKARVIPAACCLVIALLFVAAPAMAQGTTSITVTKYHDNNYSAVEDSEILDLAALQGLSSVYSNGPVYMQGGTFDYNLSEWAYTSGSMSNFGEQTGTYVRNITDRVGGMNAGDEIWVVAADGYRTYFNHTNVYAPHVNQGEMILSWENDTSIVPAYEDGMRLFFYTPSDLSFTNADMRDSMAPWYWRQVKDKFAPYGIFPSAKGLSSKLISDLKIYPPHRYDFNTTGDTTEWAYEGSVGASPGLNNPSDTTVDIARVADVDALRESTPSSSGNSAAQRFVFNVVEDPAKIETLAVTWLGSGTRSGSNGATLYIWDDSTGDYEPLATTSLSSEVTLTETLTGGFTNYVLPDGNVTVLVKQNGVTTGPNLSTLATNYVKLVVTHHHTNS